ncbi:hypothetical protein Fmac_001267 [Flemingia macrophylla]|uniref:Uncharacterized protein n=1 Tax=Flemingia macrophylla TaxID=520843 RepID=A0ABD1NHV3_9FABA
MAPKKRKVEGDSSSAGQQHIYRSIEHALHSVKVEKRSILMERELKLEGGDFLEFLRELRRRKGEENEYINSRLLYFYNDEFSLEILKNVWIWCMKQICW